MMTTPSRQSSRQLRKASNSHSLFYVRLLSLSRDSRESQQIMIYLFYLHIRSIRIRLIQFIIESKFKKRETFNLFKNLQILFISNEKEKKKNLNFSTLNRIGKFYCISLLKERNMNKIVFATYYLYTIHVMFFGK